MKTRKKNVKTPNKTKKTVNRVKKSPIVRQNTRRNTSYAKKVLLYESPMQSFRNNSSETSHQSATDEDSSKDQKIDQQASTSKKLLADEVKTEVLCKSVEKDGELETSIETSSKRKRKRKSGIKSRSEKNKKPKKSPLSRIKDSTINPQNSENIIIIDTTLEDSILKPEEVQSEVKMDSKPSMSYSDEIIVLDDEEDDHDDNDSNDVEQDDDNQVVGVDSKPSNESFMEMEAYHDALTHDESSTLPTINLVDSIICIEDDDTPVQSSRSREKQTEDCCVVWSSSPSTSADNCQRNRADAISRLKKLENDPNILLYDKILVDTTADMTNLRFLNNEPERKNNYSKKSLLSKPNKLSKLTSKTAESLVAKRALRKVTKSVSAKQVKKKSQNNGELIYQSADTSSPKVKKGTKGSLREIVIDGNNVAMAYTNNKNFSEKGIKMLIDYFLKKGHTVKVFVPQYRRAMHFPLLEKWNKDGIVVFTPSRKLGNKHFTPYDDRYILEYAIACDGIVVSQDQFRDLYNEKLEYRDTIENRLLPPTFVGDYVMFPEDPLGRNGPTLANFLKH